MVLQVFPEPSGSGRADRAIATHISGGESRHHLGELPGDRAFAPAASNPAGETTLYITPKLLHIKLWSDWWDLYGQNLNVEQFLGAIPDTLYVWFFDMFAYAHGARTVRKIVRTILSAHGSFFQHGLVKFRVGANFFELDGS